MKSITVGLHSISLNETLHVHTPPASSPNAAVWATDAKTQTPLILDFAKGTGHIYLVLCEYGLDKNDQKLSRLFQTLIDSLYNEFVGITRTGNPCQMLINRRKDDTLVTLMNHTGTPWQGKIAFHRQGYPAVEEIRDLIHDHAYPQSLIESNESRVTVQVKIQAYGEKILSFGPKRTDQSYRGFHTTDSGASEDDGKFLAEIRSQGPTNTIGQII